MKTRCPKIISGVALATVLASTVMPALPAEKQQGIEGVWDVRITVVQCDTRAAIFTGRAILRYIDGGSFAEISDNFLHSAGLGTWRHLRGRNYTAVDRFFV